MHQSIHRLRLFCCFFSGEDDFIIRKCNKGIQLAFALIGIFVILVFALCWFSAALFMAHIFDGARWVSIPVGILWALLVTNLYLLLLYTLSPALLPVAHKRKVNEQGKIKKEHIGRKSGKSSVFSFSFFFRTGIIVLLALIIAQPVNVWLFAPGYEEADRFAEAIRHTLSENSYARITTLLFCIVMLLPVVFKYRVRKISERNFRKDFEGGTVQEQLKELRTLLSVPSDIKRLSGIILAADLSAIRTSDFYFQKALLEYRVILEEYRQFRTCYSAVLMQRRVAYRRQCWLQLFPLLDKLRKADQDRHRFFYEQLKHDLQEEKTEKYEYWSDPPFRTQRRTLAETSEAEADLLQTLYQHQP